MKKPLVFLKKNWIYLGLGLIVVLGAILAWMLIPRAGADTQGTAYIQGSTSTTSIDVSKGENVTLSWQTKVRTRVRVVIKNSNDTQVKVITDSKWKVGIGTYSTTWNGTDSSGVKVPAGTYKVYFQAVSYNSYDLKTISVLSNPTGSISIKSITPATINPSNAEITTITWNAPQVSRYRIYAENSSGTEVAGIITYADLPAGDHTNTWGGKTAAGTILPNGSYKIVIIEDIATPTLQPARGDITIGNIPVPGITVKSIVPSTIDPSTGQTTTITYNVPQTDNYSIFIRDGNGQPVTTIATLAGVAAGDHTQVWNGKTPQGVAVPDATYTLVVAQDKVPANITSGTGSITISHTPPPPPSSGNLGNPVEGFGSANFNWLTTNSVKFGLGFKSDRTSQAKTFHIPWKISGSYGAGTRGKYEIKIVKENPATHFPSENAADVVGSISNVSPPTSDAQGMNVDIAANLNQGMIYHVVVRNIDSNPASNWSSPNTLMTRERTWDGIGGSTNTDENDRIGVWQPWTSGDNIWTNPNKQYSVPWFKNGSYVPVAITWQDSQVSGTSFYSATSGTPPPISNSDHLGEQFTWNKDNVNIRQIKISVQKVTNGRLVGHLESLDGTASASANMSDVTTPSGSSDNDLVPAWSTGTLSTPIDLVRGKTYRIWFEAPAGKYQVYFPYVEGGIWPALTWGGVTNYPIFRTGGTSSAWQKGVKNYFGDSNYNRADLTFDLIP